MQVSILSSSMMTYAYKGISLASKVPLIKKLIPASPASDDLILVKALNELGISSEIVAWNSRTDWKKYNICVIRSTWDYHKSKENISKFLTVMERIEKQGISLLNPYATIKWNIDKIYLKELSDNGVPVVDTIWLEQKELVSLEKLIENKGWKDCVIKPTISAGGMLTKKFNVKDSPKIIDELLKASNVVDRWMVQPFMEEIITEGEKSFIFIQNRFSHCVLKKPSKDSILVQKGTVSKIHPSPEVIAQAERILNLANQQTLYARVDVIEKNNQLLLMELELIEPCLYLYLDEAAPHKLALAIRESVNQNQSQ